MSRRALLLAAGIVSAVSVGGPGCTTSEGGGGGGGGGGSVNPHLAITGGSNQVRLPGGIVHVTAELTGGEQIDNQTINWAVRTGGGTVPATSVTSNTGVATIDWTLGSTVGEQKLEASFSPPTGPSIVANLTAAGVTNPACVPGTTDVPALSWAPGNGALVLVQGQTLTSGTLTIAAGTTVCVAPFHGIFLNTGARLVASGTAGAPITITSMDLADRWGAITFDGAPATGSTVTYLKVEHSTFGLFGANPQHPITISHATITGAESQGLQLLAGGSSFTQSVVTGSGAAGAILAADGGGTVTFSGRVTGSSQAGVVVTGPGVQLTNCEVTGNAGGGVQGAATILPLSIHGCNIHDNDGYELSSLDFTGTVDATGNWWGTAGGPGALDLAGQVNAGSPLSSPVTLGYLRLALASRHAERRGGYQTP